MTCVATAFGISLGNSTCCISVNRNGNVDVVANASGERVTPAVVGFHDNEVVTGTAAKQALLRHDKCSAVGALRAIGSTSQDELVFPLNLKCQLLYENKKNKFVIQDGERNKVVSPEEVLRHLFSLLKDIACSHSNEEKLPVVITVPAWATDSAISAVHNSANSAGFHVIKTILQPAAACLAYNLLSDNKVNLNVLIFHCGGTSIVASLGEISGGLLCIKETSNILIASGDAITSLLVDHFAKEFFMKYKGNPLENRRSKRKLYNVSENCKHVLSTMNTAQVHVESLWEGVDFSTQLSRARFDGLVASTLLEFLVPVNEVLERVNLTYDQVDKVILTGGTCKIPKLQNLMGETFSKAEILKRLPSDESLAIGAAEESSFYLEGKSIPLQSTTSIVSCLALPIHVKIQEANESQCIFRSGTPTLSRQSLSLECPAGPCNLVIYEGEDSMQFQSEYQVLAEIELNFVDSSDLVILQLECTLKSDGNLVIKLSESLSKTYKSFVIEAGRN